MHREDYGADRCVDATLERWATRRRIKRCVEGTLMGYNIEDDIGPHISVRLDNHGGDEQREDREAAERLREESRLAIESLIDGDPAYKKIAVVC